MAKVKSPEEPRFQPTNAAISDRRYARSANEAEAIYPSDASDQIADAISGIDFRSSLSTLNSLAEIKRRLVHRAALAYPQDMLEGQTTNNSEGLANYLGYDPQVDKPIGYMVPKSDGNELYKTVLVGPTFVTSSDGTDGHWRVYDNLINMRPVNLNSPFDRYASHSPTGSAGLDKVSVEFPSFEDAMQAIHQDLIACGYEIYEPEPQLSSNFDADLTESASASTK